MRDVNSKLHRLYFEENLMIDNFPKNWSQAAAKKFLGSVGDLGAC